MIIIRQGLFAFLVVVSVDVVSSLKQLVGEDERSNAAEEGAEEAPAPEGAAVEFEVVEGDKGGQAVNVTKL